jgi:hypothetical protein
MIGYRANLKAAAEGEWLVVARRVYPSAAALLSNRIQQVLPFRCAP